MAISADLKENLRIAQMKLLTATPLKMFGCIIYKFEVEIVDKPITAACMLLNKRLRIEMGAEFMKTLNNKELIFVLIHEILHFINGHLRMGPWDKLLMNLAQDHIINDQMRMDIEKQYDIKNYIEIPESAFFVDKFKDKNVISYEVYEWLKKHAKTISIKIVSKSGSEQCQSQKNNKECSDSGDNDSDKQKEENSQQGQANDLEMEITIEIDGKKETVRRDIEYGDDKEANKVSEELKANIRTMINSRLKGTEEGFLVNFLKQIIEVEIPWDEILEKAINNTLVASPDTRSWRSINKRFYTYGITLPSSDVEEIKDNLYIIVDTSGSISDNTIAKFIDIVKKSLNHFNKIIVITHDTSIKVYKKLDKDIFEDEFKNMWKISRGGTSHVDVFNRIEKDFKENNDEIGLILLLTDFCSDIENIWNNYEWVNFIPIKVIVQESSDTNHIPDYIDTDPIIIKEKTSYS